MNDPYTLRLSLTRTCNLRCVYCHPADDARPDRISLESEAFLGLVAAIAQTAPLGKLRLTGGEPLLFPDLAALVRRLRELLPDCELCLTTNGLDLARFVEPLKAAGLARLTVSLDAADAVRYRAICGHDGFERVLAGLSAARAAGFGGLKINTVLLASQSAQTLAAQIELARRFGAEARFIELMPVGPAKAMFARERLDAETALRLLAEAYPEQTDLGQDGTARRVRLSGPAGDAEIGLIRPLSAPFCGACNRLRLDAAGRLYTCLRQSRGTDLYAPWRRGEHEELRRRIAGALASKHPLRVWPERAMQNLGG